MIGAPALAAVAVLLAVVGAGLLRAGWARRRLDGRTAAGWIVSAAGAVAWRAAGPAWDMAVALAVLSSSLAALAWLASGVELGGRRPRRRARCSSAPEPAPVRGAVWTAVVRTLSVGPIAGSAALGLAVAIALRAPLEEADRLVTAGFVLPLAWAVGGVWSMTDPRASRAAAGLAVTAGVAFGGAWL